MFNNYNRGVPYWVTPEQFNIVRIRHACRNAKIRASEKGIPYDIDPNYMLSIYPSDSRCPVFGIEMIWGDADGQENSPSIDRIHPSLGYIKGNVVWVSKYANRLKSDHSLDTLRTLLAFYEKLERRNE